LGNQLHYLLDWLSPFAASRRVPRYSAFSGLGLPRQPVYFCSNRYDHAAAALGISISKAKRH
jgi:hypothetical protein